MKKACILCLPLLALLGFVFSSPVFAAGTPKSCSDKRIGPPKTEQVVFLEENGSEDSPCIDFRLANGKTKCLGTSRAHSIEESRALWDKVSKLKKGSKVSITYQKEQYWHESAASCAEDEMLQSISPMMDSREAAAGGQAQREVKAREQAKAALDAAGVIALSPNTMNWKDARAYCESKGGRLPLVNGRTSWNGDRRGSASIEAFGAVGSPWPSWLASDTPYWTDTGSTAGGALADKSWDVRNNGGHVDVGSNSKNRSYPVICIRR